MGLLGTEGRCLELAEPQGLGEPSCRGAWHVPKVPRTPGHHGIHAGPQCSYWDIRHLGQGLDVWDPLVWDSEADRQQSCATAEPAGAASASDQQQGGSSLCPLSH